jgi:hypothetical protein
MGLLKLLAQREMPQRGLALEVGLVFALLVLRFVAQGKLPQSLVAKYALDVGRCGGWNKLLPTLALDDTFSNFRGRIGFTIKEWNRFHSEPGLLKQPSRNRLIREHDLESRRL